MRQYCWSHVTRNLLSAQELARTAAGKRFCREALALQRRLFRLWHRFRGDPRVRGGPLTRVQLIAKARPLESHLTRRLFGSMLRRIWALPVPAG
jgi:hypothetical protein